MSRLVFDQTTGRYSLIKLIYKINHYITLRTQTWFEVYKILCVFKSKFIVIKHLNFISLSLVF